MLPVEEYVIIQHTLQSFAGRGSLKSYDKMRNMETTDTSAGLWPYSCRLIQRHVRPIPW